MMVKKSERFTFIIDLAVRQEQDALQLMGASQQKLLAQQNQLEQLINYRLEKQASFIAQQAAGLSIMQFREMRAFADKLDQAIDAQKSTVANHEQDLARARTHWEQSHQRRKSLEKIRELAKVKEMKIEDKREQVELDTRSARSRRKDGM